MLQAKYDVLGTAFHDYYFNGNSKGIIDVYCSASGYEKLPVKHFFRKYEQMPLIEQKGLSLCKGKILDTGAGAGCHSSYLQNKEFEVCSLEISGKACEILKSKGLNDIINTDFYKLKDRKFDTLLMLMNGAGISTKLDNLDVFFTKCRELLNDDGIIILDSSDLIYLFEDDETEMDWNKKYYGEVTYQLTYKNIKGKPFDWLFVDFNTLYRFASRNGFSCTKIIEDDHFGYLALLEIN